MKAYIGQRGSRILQVASEVSHWRFQVGILAALPSRHADRRISSLANLSSL